MKSFFLCLFLVGSVLTTASLRMAVADDATAPATGSTNASSGTAPAEGQGERFEKLKAALAQLDLSDAQKEQIKQIRATVTDRKERRQEIFAVLTPEQRTKLWQMIQEHRNQTQGGEGATAAPSGT
jgi:Spy/CpxP family protein refolding chaperone